MKKLTMVLALMIMVTMMGSSIVTAEACTTVNDFEESVFKFNYQYTVTDRPDDELGPNVTALNKGTIFAIEGGLFITSANNLNKLDGETYSDEVYYTKFEFKTKPLFSKKEVTTVIYGYYELVYVDKKLDIAVFTGDDFMNSHAKPMKLADKYNSYSDLLSVGYTAASASPKLIWAKTEADNVISFAKSLNSGQSGSPILDEDGQVLGVLGSKEFINGKDVYFINLQNLKKVVGKSYEYRNDESCTKR